MKQKAERQKPVSNARNLVITGMFTAILVVLSQIIIPIQPIPFTLSLFAIFLTGALLPPRFAFLAVLAYDLLGAFGLPVFAGMKGGFQVIAGATGGFIMAYPAMAFLTALFYKYARRYKMPVLLLGMLVSLILCYLMGSLWFAFTTGSGFHKALTLCVLPFILFDLIKIAMAASLAGILQKTAWKM